MAVGSKILEACKKVLAEEITGKGYIITIVFMGKILLHGYFQNTVYLLLSEYPQMIRITIIPKVLAWST